MTLLYRQEQTYGCLNKQILPTDVGYVNQLPWGEFFNYTLTHLCLWSLAFPQKPPTDGRNPFVVWMLPHSLHCHLVCFSTTLDQWCFLSADFPQKPPTDGLSPCVVWVVPHLLHCHFTLAIWSLLNFASTFVFLIAHTPRNLTGNIHPCSCYLYRKPHILHQFDISKVCVHKYCKGRLVSIYKPHRLYLSPNIFPKDEDFDNIDRTCHT